MLPTIEDAKRELKAAAQLNPGPWINHSFNVGIAAGNIAEKISGMDSDKAYIVGLLHDIGRRVGIVDIPKHVYEGYLYCMEKGWDEAARICMTHSYLCAYLKLYHARCRCILVFVDCSYEALETHSFNITDTELAKQQLNPFFEIQAASCHKG